ncbi:hypothetical protein ABPG72_010544 [Tetrahymena utriculariae]
MKSSTKSSCFNELNIALKAIKKNQQPQKLQQQNTLNNLFNRSSSQASNILLTQTSQSTQQNIDIFSQRNSNANLKLQMNASNKLEKKPSNEIIRASCVDGRKSPQISSPRIKERSDKAVCQTSGRKSQYSNNSNLSGNNTSAYNARQVVGQIKISLSKSQSKKNIFQQIECQKESSSQNFRYMDQSIGKNVKSEASKLSRTQSKAKLISPDKKNLRSQDKNLQSSKKKNTQFIAQKRQLEPNQESDRNGFNLSSEEDNYHFNNKENCHENIQTLSHLMNQNPQKKVDEQNVLLDSFNKKRDSQKFNNSIQQALLKKRSEGLLENKIPNLIAQIQQQNQQERCDSQGGHNKNNKAQQNSIHNILSRAKSQEKIQFNNNFDQSSIPYSNGQEQQLINSQSQSSMAIMMMILNSSNSAKTINNTQSNNNNQTTTKIMQKSNSKSSLHSQKNIGQSNSKSISNQVKQTAGTSNQNTQASNNSQHKQSSSTSYLKSNCSNAGNLSKSNSSLIKNNQLNYSRGISETLNDNTHIFLTDHSFTNTSNNNQNVLKYIQQQQQILNNQNTTVNSLYRVASSSNFGGRTNQIASNDNLEQQIQENMNNQFNQQNVVTQNSFSSPQNTQFNLIGDQVQKLCVDDYRKQTNLSMNKVRNSEHQMTQQIQKSYLDLVNRQNANNMQLQSNAYNQNLNKCQSSSNINHFLNSQSDFIDQNINSLLKIPNNNYQTDLKTEQSPAQLGSSSTNKRILNSSFNKINNSINPIQQPQQNQQYLQQQQAQKQNNNISSPKSNNQVVQNQTESSFSLTQQPAFLVAQGLNIGNQNAANSNQNVLISQYVQSYNANRTNTQQSETNFTFQNNSQNPSTSVVQQPQNYEQDFAYQAQEEEQMYIKLSNISNTQQIHQNQQPDKYATSCFQGNNQEDEQQLETIQRRCSQPIQKQQKSQNLANQNQKPFSVLFNNLFSSKNVNSKQNNTDERGQILTQNKNTNQIKRKNSNSLVSYNTNLINLTNNAIKPNPKTESSPTDNKQENRNELAQKITNQGYINSLIIQRNSQGILPQEVKEKYKYKRTPSLTQFNFCNQQSNIQTQPLSNKNTSFEGFNFNIKNYQQNQQQQINFFQDQFGQNAQKQQNIKEQQISQEQNDNNQFNQIDQKQQNLNLSGQTHLQKQMQVIYDKMKQKLIHYKSAEQKWNNEKITLLSQVESLQNQVNFLSEENSLYKKSVVTYNNQNEKQLTNSLYSSIDAIFQNF